MNNDLISRESLKEDFDVAFFNDFDDYKKALRIIDNAPTVEPCYQTTSCLDCGNYDKENHNCPRYCEVIKEAINSRPQGEWAFDEKGYFYCDQCGKYPHDQYATTDFCPNCGADMKGGEE